MTYASARHRLHILALTTALFAAPLFACAQSVAAPGKDTQPMKIRLLIHGQVIPATLYDNSSARDLYTMLPLTLALEDYAATEKIGYPPRKLDTTAAPEGHAPAVGDITYYAPWGNLALFHKGFRYSSGLVSLGKIESGVELLRLPGKVAVVVERVE
jgi:hypothetical protein